VSSGRAQPAATGPRIAPPNPPTPCRSHHTLACLDPFFSLQRRSVRERVRVHDEVAAVPLLGASASAASLWTLCQPVRLPRPSAWGRRTLEAHDSPDSLARFPRSPRSLAPSLPRALIPYPRIHAPSQQGRPPMVAVGSTPPFAREPGSNL
jgi:hypothetical protein